MANSVKTEPERREKGFSSHPVQTPGEQLAKGISSVANPLFVAIPFFGFVALSTAPSLVQGLLWWAIIFLGFTVAMFLFIRRGVKQGRYTDAHVSVRSQRFFPLSFGFVCLVIIFLTLLLLHASRQLLATLTATLAALLVALLLTQFARYKISFHLIGVTGAVTVCCLLAGPFFLFLSPLILLVGWARWKVEAHSPLQAVCGATLAVLVTLGTFRVFGI
jgi:hypothetical protein